MMEDEREQKRWRALHRLEEWLELPMVVLGVLWLVLLVVELTRGLTPGLQLAVTAIWVLFIADFLLRLALAPRRGDYLRNNWLTLIALLVPALRVLRVARAVTALRGLRAIRSLRLLRLLTSLSRGMRALAGTLNRRGFIYVAALTMLVILAGAAGMYAFEGVRSGGRLSSYGEALWWTAMLVTTIGSEYWPQTPEGRVLCLLLATYSIGIFGYIAGTLASFFIGQDTGSPDTDVAGEASLRTLHEEITLLRSEVRALRRE